MRGLSSNCRRAEDAEGERGEWCVRAAASTCHDGVRGAGRKDEKDGRKRERGGGSRWRRKRSYDRAFLVASIHVSSVTRVMSVGNTRFLESSGAVFSFRPLIPRLLSLSLFLSLSFFLFSALPCSGWLKHPDAIYYCL